MHIACVSYFYDERLESPEALIEAYSTLSGWAEGLACAGARVTVVQRYSRNAHIVHRNVDYQFVANRTLRAGSLLDIAPRVNRVVAHLGATVVHVNGLPFAWPAWWLKRQIPQTPMMIQDHANVPPGGSLRAARMRFALRRMDAVSFAALEQARPWRERGFLRSETPAFALMEGSTNFRLLPRAAARRETGLEGDPLCLWVGRLDANKDPLTVLEGFARAVPSMPDPQLAMVYGNMTLLPEVRAWLAGRPEVSDRVTLLGKLPHAQLEAIYNSADLFLLGSHHEGSGYAALEALACGVIPVLTDIPSFRALLSRGDAGMLWSVGDADSLAIAVAAASRKLTQYLPGRIRAYFDAHWSFDAIGREAMMVYRQLLDGKRH